MNDNKYKELCQIAMQIAKTNGKNTKFTIHTSIEKNNVKIVSEKQEYEFIIK